MLGCGKLLSVGGEFVVQQVVELLYAHPLVVLCDTSVAGKMLYNKFSSSEGNNQENVHGAVFIAKQL